ncbi:ImmA/IrrE family metallo-endopeptidase [Clostridium sp. SHJSY1]|uniref:ImmA/IrrE family metallo-endopeptidase n=1 Tax=Clostridium sp. SHJSY1 TaxID=2942483 RepID=UPI0028771211|nr:ImmA/IrrE family metallo-endopeptidase [Clostridium sp. SHJSY1]MDS0525498.1 ImmA/IrrE family metallo-endopeptidase [Clostridium sp. SHJSY1]
MNNYIKKEVNELKINHGTNNPFEIVKQDKDIELIIEPLGKIWGMYKYINKTKTIFLNSNLNEHQQRFVLAHELGHAILHPRSSCFFVNTLNTNKLKKEYEANLFAAELLIDFSSIDVLYMQGYSINQLACHYMVPTELVEFRFKENRKLY